MLHFGQVDETTRRLVERCLRVGWLSDGHEDGVSETHVENKKLGIGGNVKAGESSLSVLEVAAHKEKPGVQTPSLGLGKKDASNSSGGEEPHRSPEAEAEDQSVGNGVAINTGTDRRDKDEDTGKVDLDLDLDLEPGGLKSPFELEE